MNNPPSDPKACKYALEKALEFRKCGYSSFSHGDYLNAMNHFQNAIDISKKTWGPGFFDQVPALLGLCEICFKLDDLNGAECYAKCLIQMSQHAFRDTQRYDEIFSPETMHTIQGYLKRIEKVRY